MKSRLKSAIRNEILKRIPMNKLNTEDKEGLLALDLRELFSKFYNWQNRFISVRRRSVHLSPELQARNSTEVKELADKIEKGYDLTLHLSKRVEKVFIANPRQPCLGSGREDLDLLLNEWGIHHLHTHRGSAELLFVTFRHDDAYLLDLLDHKAWTKESLVEIAVTNWPNAGLFTINPRMTLEFPVPERSRWPLRAAAINTPVQLPVGIVSGPGMVRSGTSAAIEIKINKLWADIAQDEGILPEAEILDRVRNALKFHPFSDR